MTVRNDRTASYADGLRIGELATRASVNVQTIRYYERRGLLAEPNRTEAGYRIYPPETARVVRFIKRAQGLGFALEEVERLLGLRDDRVSSCDEVKALALMKIEAIEEKLQRLTALKTALETLVGSCDRGDSVRECPILEAIEERTTNRAS